MGGTRALLLTGLCLVVLLNLLNGAFADPRASASHILVDTEEKAMDLKKQLDEGADFATLAKEHSTCPSSSRGGSLGTFGRHQMVAEFDQVVFEEEVGVVHGPVKTQFGYHLILITDRTE